MTVVDVFEWAVLKASARSADVNATALWPKRRRLWGFFMSDDCPPAWMKPAPHYGVQVEHQKGVQSQYLLKLNMPNLPLF